MTMRKLTSLTANLFLVFISCGGNENREEIPVQLVEKGALEIPLDTRTSYRTNSLTYWIDSMHCQQTEYLVQLERNIPAIHFYDLEKKQLSHSIVLIEEGPQGVGIPGGVKLLSKDSILIISDRPRRISLINGLNELLYSCNLFKSGQLGGRNTGKAIASTSSQANI